MTLQQLKETLTIIKENNHFQCVSKPLKFHLKKKKKKVQFFYHFLSYTVNQRLKRNKIFKKFKITQKTQVDIRKKKNEKKKKLCSKYTNFL